MDGGGVRLDQVVIDLVSDSDEGDTIEDELDGTDARLERNRRNTIDLTSIPDIDVPPLELPRNPTTAAHEGSHRGAKPELITEAECLQTVLNILPAISVDYVRTLIREKTTDQTRTTAHCEQIVTQLLDGTHPTEADAANQRKRKREDDDDIGRYEKGEEDRSAYYQEESIGLLQNEFLSIPVKHITSVLREHKTLFKAYEVLEDQSRIYQQGTSPFVNIKKARFKYDTKLIKPQPRAPTLQELQAARKKSSLKAAKRRELKELENAEEANLEQAKLNKEMGECQCCFSEYPLNRMVSCDGDDIHFFCFDCFKQYVNTEMGQSHCRPVCFATENCTGLFSRQQLGQVLEKKTFDRLEHMQQQQDLEAAGLDFLSECPFCDFKMECPPVEVDKEFRCQNNKCRKTSCRLCQQETHIPLSCKEAKKDEQLTLRHVVEEAMSAALIRKCNRCKHNFVKEYGCNKMTCSHCGNLQCYVCSKNVTDYNHFADGGTRGHNPSKSCPLHEDVEARHEQEVKKAADAAMAKVKAENPGISDADLMIKVSDRVKQADTAQKARQAGGLGIPHPLAQGGAGEMLVLPPFPQLAAPHFVPHQPPNFLYPPVNPPVIQNPPPGFPYAAQGLHFPPRGVQHPPRHHFPRRPNQPF